MEKRITLCKIRWISFLLFLIVWSMPVWGNTPVMDGSYSPDEGWGEAIATNAAEGWAGANAKTLYVTSDANYIYFGAEVSADEWQSWGFVINASGVGGIPDDVWTYPITYEHDPRPDFVIKGNFGGYAELREWDGESGNNQLFSITDGDKGISTNFVEVRIARASLGSPEIINVQFYISGNNDNEHATFDAVPADEVAGSWNTSTSLQNYVENIDVSYEGETPDPEITFVNLQFPWEATVAEGGSIDVYTQITVINAEVDENGVEGVKAWVGYGNEDVHPENWTNWVEAEYNGLGGSSGRPEYKGQFGSDLQEGAYYFASRFQLNDDDYVYGGYSSGGGGFWDGVNYVSGILNIEEPVPNYGIREEEGNLPTLTYSLTATGNENTLKGDELEGYDLGTVFELFLRGASIQTWKDAGGDITGAQLQYKVWETGENEPAEYEVIDVSWSGNDPNDANLQTWAGFGDPVALTTSLVPGNYQLQVLFTISGSGVPGITENGPFTAEFVLAEPSSAAEITGFTIEHQSGDAVINSSQATVGATVKYGTSLTAVVPQIAVSQGAQLSPASGEAQDFTLPVMYTVTAEDGTTKEWTVTVEEAAIGWANLQHPASGTIAPQGEFMVYARVYVDGLTGGNATTESLDALSAWIGYSNTDATSTEDFASGWTWVEASLAEYSENFGNNSEYSANIGTGLTEEGTFYYVSRFQLGEEGDFAYGGYENGFWDGTTQVSGELTVEIPQPNYGMQDDDGINLPSLTYWYTGEAADINEQGADFHEKDLGVIHDLYLKGANIKTWKAEGGDVTGTQLQYKVWKSSETEPGSWTTREVQFTSGDGDGNQIWAGFGDEISITDDLSSGDYTLTVRFRVNGTGVPGKIEDGPYTMEFALDRLSSAADITAFVIEGAMGDAVINKEAATVDVTMPYDADVSALTPQITVSSGASIVPASGVEQDFTHPVEYVVTAEDGTEKQWTATATLAEKPEITWANLQHPASGTIQPESEFMVYARVFAENLTGADATEESLQKLSAWIGYSDNDAATSADFETGWTWVEATLDDYDAIFGNNSQFSADIGSGIATEGTLYYVSRFQYGTDDFVYGGFEGGFWNGTDNVSGVLEVEPPAPEYGIRDDDGANLPRITYWYTGAVNDIEQTGAQMEQADLGEVTAFYIKGVSIKTWKSGEGNVTDAWFHYKVWSADDAEPQDYHVIDIGWTSNDNAEETLQTWAELEDEIALHEGLEVGDYHLKIKFSIAGTGVPGITENGPFTVGFAIEEEPVLHTLTLTASPEGAGLLTGAGDYEEGNVVDVAAVAEDGYEFVNWTDEDGIEISDQAAFAFTMPGADVTLTANFAAIPQTPYIVSITPVDDVVVAWGTSLEDAIAELAGETTITDSEGEQHTVALSWEIPGYDAQQAVEYDATAVFVLPEGVVQNPHNPLDLSVEAKVRVDEPTAVSEAETKSIRLYPNPASGVVNITSATAIHSLILMDITGRVVYSSNVNDFQWQLNLDSFRPGIYLIRLHTAGGSSVKRLQISR